LDSGSMAPSLPGVVELRDEDQHFWYRLFYTHLGGIIVVLDCITKTTNETAQSDIERCRIRLKRVKEEIAKRAKEEKNAKKK
jgi:phage-related protein